MDRDEESAMKNLLLLSLFMAAALAVPGSARQASAQGAGVQIGVLTCDTIRGTRRNLIIHSTVSLDCTFNTPSGAEKYRGESGIALGLDLNWGRQEKIHYAVISGMSDYRLGSYALVGKYVGGKASATLGIGVGAAALVGGGEKNFSLQPLALETSTGLGVSGGIGYLFLAAPN
jgi:hypothetical protein